MVERPVFSCGVASTGLSMSLISVRVISVYCLTKRREGEGQGPSVSPCVRRGAAREEPVDKGGGNRLGSEQGEYMAKCFAHFGIDRAKAKIGRAHV